MEKERNPRARVGKIEIYCGFDELVDIEKVIPNPQNPNDHPESQIELLAKIIEAQGFRMPITVSKRSGFIVKGHGRLLAAKKLGMAQVPIDFQNYQSEAEEYADLIADNRLAELLGKSKRGLEALSARFHWVDRAEKYDDFIERQIRKSNEEEIIQMAKRHADIAVAMQNKALNALQKIDADDLKANDITNMIKTAIDIERTSRGEATEITKTDANVSGEIQVGIYLPDNKR